MQCNNLDQIKWIFDAGKMPKDFERLMKAAIDNLVIPNDANLLLKFNVNSPSELLSNIKLKFSMIFSIE